MRQLIVAALAACSGAALATSAAAQGYGRAPYGQQQRPQPQPQYQSAFEYARETMQTPIPDRGRWGLRNDILIGAEPDGGGGDILEFRPIFALNSDDRWGVVHDAAFPVMYLSEEIAGDSGEFGLGDVRYAFLVARRSYAYGPDFAFGPAFTLPTATDAELGFKRLTVGPEVRAEWETSVWRYGFSAVQRWSIGESDSYGPVSQLTLEPFAFLNLEQGWYAFSDSAIRADWERDDDQWAIPLGFGMGRVVDMGEGRPIDVRGSIHKNVTNSDGDPKWIFRVQVQAYLGR